MTLLLSSGLIHRFRTSLCMNWALALLATQWVRESFWVSERRTASGSRTAQRKRRLDSEGKSRIFESEGDPSQGSGNARLVIQKPERRTGLKVGSAAAQANGIRR